MRCKTAKILVSASIDGELTERQGRALARHLAACHACAAEREEILSLSDSLRALSEEEPSPWLAPRFSEALANLSRKPERARPRGLLGLGAAVAAAAVLIFAVHSRMNVPPPPAPAPPAVVQAPVEIEPAPTPAQAPLPKAPRPATRVRPARRPDRTSWSASTKPLPSRSGSKPGAEALIRANMLAAQAAGEDAVTTMAANLTETQVTVAETLESVRGALRQSADILAMGTPVEADSTPRTDGGESL
ncbi:MAG: zf-HC2 domain-containing protein [Armatimonadota bacterium]